MHTAIIIFAITAAALAGVWLLYMLYVLFVLTIGATLFRKAYRELNSTKRDRKRAEQIRRKTIV